MYLANAILNGSTGEIIEEIPAPLIEYLVLEGGGVRGVAYGGVLMELETAGMLSSIKHVAGSSIGAIIGMLVALGYDIDELKEIMRDLSFKKFLEEVKPWSFTPDVLLKGKQYLTIVASQDHSISSGNLFYQWLEACIERKLGNKQATFADLAKSVKTSIENNPYKYLSVTGSNISRNRLEVFDCDNTPTMPIATAVRISASFPGVFKAVEWNNGQSLDIYMDGGLMNNLPSFIFNQRKYLPLGFEFNDHAANPGILNLKIDTREEVEKKRKTLKGIKDYSMAVIDGMQSRDKEIYDQFSTNTIQIYDCDIDTLQFDLSEEGKNRLIDSGREAALQWLQTHVSEAYMIKKYKNEEEWLASKSIEEIVEIKKCYENSSEQTLSKEEIKNKIIWFNHYLDYRYQKLLHGNSESKFEYTPHINLTTVIPRIKIDENIKNAIKNWLTELEEQIKYFEHKYQCYQMKLDLSEIEALHDMTIFDHIVYLTGLNEKIKFLKNAKCDLQNKMQIKTQCLNRSMSSTNERSLLSSEMNGLLEKSIPLTSHIPLLTLFCEHLADGSFVCPGEGEVTISFDLRDTDDFKIYLIACLLYFKSISIEDILTKSTWSHYQNIFLADDIPKNIEKLGCLLKKDKTDLLLSAYRIERLIKYFLRIDKPKELDKLLDMNIDDIFCFLSATDRDKYKITTSKNKNGTTKDTNNIEMSFLYSSFSQDFFLFKNNSFCSSSLKLESDTFSKNTLETAKQPKCLRRLS